MKAAMWGVGLIVLGVLGLVLINLFGNITVTNQFNYTTMKNAVQAAMLDSLDIEHYRVGFCLCSKKTLNANQLNTFTDKSDYNFMDITDDKCLDNEGKELKNCVTLYGEYRLKETDFKENFKKRFQNMVTNNKDYTYEIKEVIEYPPKVSVRVISKDEEFLPTDKQDGYNITNQIDAIIEVKEKG